MCNLQLSRWDEKLEQIYGAKCTTLGIQVCHLQVLRLRWELEISWICNLKTSGQEWELRTCVQGLVKFTLTLSWHESFGKGWSTIYTLFLYTISTPSWGHTNSYRSERCIALYILSLFNHVSLFLAHVYMLSSKSAFFARSTGLPASMPCNGLSLSIIIRTWFFRRKRWEKFFMPLVKAARPILRILAFVDKI